VSQLDWPEGVDREWIEGTLGERFALGQMVAVSAERILFQARDRLIGRKVSLRVNVSGDRQILRWFLKECEALAQLDHPAIRHIYEAGVVGNIAYRVGNWISGESLEEAVERGPRAIPTVHVMARDLLTALEHAHANALVVRRIVPGSLMISGAGRVTITDLRFCSLTLPEIPTNEQPDGMEFLAPEVRDGSVGDPASDIYTAGALLYFAVTGTHPPTNPGDLVPPRELRSVVPQALSRVISRAMLSDPDDRYLTAAEMLDDFAADAGDYESPQVSLPTIPAVQATGHHWETRLRRALGDDYELLETLGEGGFGRVYRVRDLHLEREVALKVLHPHLIADPSVVERFRREAQLAARLNHLNIVNIYDISGRSGLSWYTMEIVEGLNLAQLVEREGRQPLELVLRLLREGLSALGHAHSFALVHRDIKPENMLLERDGSLKITDFGLALALRREGKFEVQTSQSGTLQFASPEQLLGEEVDQRTDLYSLAAVAYFILLGRVPFPGSTPEQILAKQTADLVPELTLERPEVGEALAAVLARGLRNDVATRWSSAGEFRSAIEEAVQVGIRRRGGELARLAARILGA
jgi:serine/threonine protein kinase